MYGIFHTKTLTETTPGTEGTVEEEHRIRLFFSTLERSGGTHSHTGKTVIARFVNHNVKVIVLQSPFPHALW
jgi:hypothetical protein